MIRRRDARLGQKPRRAAVFCMARPWRWWITENGAAQNRLGKVKTASDALSFSPYRRSSLIPVG